MKILIFSEKENEFSELGWFRGGTKISYYQNKIRRPSCSKCFYSLSFSYKFDYSDDTVYFAYSFPYTYTDLMQDLQVLENILNSIELRLNLRAASPVLQTQSRPLKRSDVILNKPRPEPNRSKNSPKNWPKINPFERRTIKNNTDHKTLQSFHLPNKRKKHKLKSNSRQKNRQPKAKLPQARWRRLGLHPLPSSICKLGDVQASDNITNSSRKSNCSKNRSNTSTTIAARWR